MLTLADLKENEKAVVLKIKADGELKRRLASLGLRKNSEISVKTFGIKKSVVEVEVGTSLIALRYEEAKEIEVEKV
ncbi:ferrous iron transport protein A [Sulfurospirillum sp. 1307]|jgi:ferrous iron transport protein A